MEVEKMKFKRHKVTKDDWLVVLVGILLGVILIWFSSVFGLDLIKRVWSSFLIIYCFSYFIGVVVNRIFKLRRKKVDKINVGESVELNYINGKHIFYAVICGITVAIGVIIALICGIYDITVVELFIKLFHAFKNLVYMFLFGGIILLVLPFIIIGKFFR